LAAGALAALGVEFVVVGGCALVLLGAADECGDLDIVPERSRDNLARLADALNELGAVPCARLSSLISRSISQFDTPFGRVDVLIQRAEAEYDELSSAGSTCMVEDAAVRVAPLQRVLELRRLHRTGVLYE
jgi:hypothetical protein